MLSKNGKNLENKTHETTIRTHEYEIIELREVTHDEARIEILNFCKKTQKFDISIIADKLKLDIFLVNEIIEELIEKGIIEEAE